MSVSGQGTIDEQVQQRIEDIERWKAWAGQLLTAPSADLGARAGDFATTAQSLASIVTGKAPPTPPPGYNAQAPEQLLAYLDDQLAYCRQQADRVRVLAGPDVLQNLSDPVASSLSDRG